MPESKLEPPVSKSTPIDPSAAPHWILFARNNSVQKGWIELCRAIPENALRCYRWLAADPTRRIPGRCYPLKHKTYAGAWAFEIGSGQRLYYTLRNQAKWVVIYYAGPHPSKAPYPPDDC